MGQSYAALLMSCDISVNPIEKKGDTQIAHAAKGINHQQHSDSNHIRNTTFSIEKISNQPSCDTEQHNCPCSMGACSSVFLPVSDSNLIFVASNRLTQYIGLFTSQYPSLLFRPPISS